MHPEMCVDFTICNAHFSGEITKNESVELKKLRKLKKKKVQEKGLFQIASSADFWTFGVWFTIISLNFSQMKLDLLLL